MKGFIQIKYQCNVCGKVSYIPNVCDFDYGLFFLSSISGEYRYLNALEDGTYKKVIDIIDQQLAKYKVDVQRVFGILTCDLSDSGNYFSIGAKHCPNCLSQDILVLNSMPKREINLKPVTHFEWNKLNEVQKKEKYLECVEILGKVYVRCDLRKIQ